jgi:hypothetical protein
MWDQRRVTGMFSSRSTDGEKEGKEIGRLVVT